MSGEVLRVGIGWRVHIRDIGDGEEEQYVIVDPSGADASAGRVSSACPLGQALLGLKPGDEAQVRGPFEVRTVRLLAIELVHPEGVC